MTHNDIVAAARRYIGVPFRHQGRSSLGMDCLGLLVKVACDCHLTDAYGRALSTYDTLHYTHFPDGDYFCAQLKEALHHVKQCEMQVGDIALFDIDNNSQHCGIITNYRYGGLGVIHAYAPARKVVEHQLDESWQNRITALFRAYKKREDF